MLVLSMPWHLVGLLGMPRRMAYYDYTHPALQPQAWTVTASAIGGLILVVSAVLFVYVLATARRNDRDPAPFTFSAPAHAGERTPALLNTFGLWVGMMIALTIVNYGYPIVAARVAARHRRCRWFGRGAVMEGERPYAWSNAGFRWSVVALVVLTVVSFLVGLLVLPAVQRDFTAAGLWESICRAAGVPAQWDARCRRRSRASRPPTSSSCPRWRARAAATRSGEARRLPSSSAACVTARRARARPMRRTSRASIRKSCTSRCRITSAATAAARSCRRIARNLSDRDIADIASYYDSLPKARTAPARYSETNAPALVRVGDPLRNIAPCIACHGGTDHKLGAPWLEGMPQGVSRRAARAISGPARGATTATHRCAT